MARPANEEGLVPLDDLGSTGQEPREGSSDRSYRKALSRAEAVAELRRASGTQFDPQVAEALVTVVARA
jgi:hypothetical protein